MYETANEITFMDVSSPSQVFQKTFLDIMEKKNSLAIYEFLLKLLNLSAYDFSVISVSEINQINYILIIVEFPKATQQ